MKRILYSALTVIVLSGLSATTVAFAAEETDMVDIIVQTSGSTADLAEKILALGGSVNVSYRNLDAVAATIPISELGNLKRAEGITKVERDRMMYLTDLPAAGKESVGLRAIEVEDMTGVNLGPSEIDVYGSFEIPGGYANFLYTGAAKIWNDTFAGDGSIVAVVDTGTVPNTCLAQAVIGAPGFPDGYNAVGDGFPATDPGNHWHGTVVGGTIASNCALDFTGAPNHPIYKAQEPYLGWPVDYVPLLGQAPLAKIYPVKVFPQDGGGAPTSQILEGLDHILTLKKNGVLDIDIVNMSLGGPTGWDGHDAYDKFIDILEHTNMLVVASAGNDGPIPNTVGSPATSFGSLSVAALDYPDSSRTLFEYLGLAYLGTPGQGLIMRPTDEVRIANFSSRGPLSDGRPGPEISALGFYNFHQGPTGSFMWVTGTSFAAPTVAGVAALLNAWHEAQGYETDPFALYAVLLDSANPDVVGEPWSNPQAQGFGVVDASVAFDKWSTDTFGWPSMWPGRLEKNILGEPEFKQTQVWESDLITVGASEPFDAVFEIGKHTSKVTIEVFDIDIPDNSSYAFWGNALEAHVQTAKRSAYGHPLDILWYPSYGDAFDLVINDGPWTLLGGPWDYLPMEPGLMKLTLLGDFSNESPISFKVRVTRENFLKREAADRVAKQKITAGDSVFVPAEIPEGVETATFDLLWNRSWEKFPTNDLDMYIYDPDGFFVSFEGATSSSPERAIIADPMPGTWFVEIDPYEVHKPDQFQLYMTLEEAAP